MLLEISGETTPERMTHWKRLWCWEGLGAGGEGDDRGWDGWVASLTRWTWVWVNSGSWWWTGRPGVLSFMGSQRVGHDWVTELNWTEATTEASPKMQGLNNNATRTGNFFFMQMNFVLQDSEWTDKRRTRSTWWQATLILVIRSFPEVFCLKVHAVPINCSIGSFFFKLGSSPNLHLEE